MTIPALLNLTSQHLAGCHRQCFMQHTLRSGTRQKHCPMLHRLPLLLQLVARCGLPLTKQMPQALTGCSVPVVKQMLLLLQQ